MAAKEAAALVACGLRQPAVTCSLIDPRTGTDGSPERFLGAREKSMDCSFPKRARPVPNISNSKPWEQVLRRSSFSWRCQGTGPIPTEIPQKQSAGALGRLTGISQHTSDTL